MGDPAYDTADFADTAPGNLRADYVLPSRARLQVMDAGVFWPVAADPLSALTGSFPFPSSDHRLHWGGDPAGVYWADTRTTDEKAGAIRSQRDADLSACDWVVTRAVEAGQAVPAAWLAYRSALRAVPQQQGFPDSVEWPAAPT